MQKNVLITGASRGIGRGIALRFAQENCNIILNCKESIDKMQTLIDEINPVNPNVIGICADVSDYAQTKQMFDKINSQFGNIDILINNAGISYYGLFNEMKSEDWNRVISVNTISVFNCSRLAVPAMIKNQQGIIINISSIWGIHGASCESVYSASKAAVNGFTKALAKELGPSGIRINAVACGVIDTDMNAGFNEDEKNALKEQIPLGHFGTVEQISDLVYFLASDYASFITGQIITIDGGMY